MSFISPRDFTLLCKVSSVIKKKKKIPDDNINESKCNSNQIICFKRKLKYSFHLLKQIYKNNIKKTSFNTNLRFKKKSSINHEKLRILNGTYRILN